MLKKNDILYFEKFLSFPNLIHGFSTKEFGDMRPTHKGSKKALKEFFEALRLRSGFTSSKFVKMNQVHSSDIFWAADSDGGKVIDSADALLTDQKDLFLSVITADCVPLLLYDKKKKFAGVTHAGWRGLYNEIIKNTVSEMFKKGSNPSDIIVGIGPCIRVCCYEVGREHTKLFSDKFSDWNFIVEKKEKVFLDLPVLAKYQLISLGIPDTNIEDGGICTYDSPTDFYSYRREGEGFGEFVGVIGRKI